MGKKSIASGEGRCEICGQTERLILAECTCGATLTVCDECYSERESDEGSGLLLECPACESED
jgi:ribosome-binding protein aMBF1 (putative translation factor)